MEEKIIRYTGFYELFEPTADLVYDCIYHNKDSETSAILQSIMLVEAAANCCIFNLKLNKKLGLELDKLSTLAKFDVYSLVKTSGNKTLDRGSAPCQDIAELIKLRNSVVHPKFFELNWSLQDDKHRSGVGVYLKTERLGLATSCSGWLPDDAITVFKAINKFFKYFFIDLCNLTEQETRLLLFSTVDDDHDDVWISSKTLSILQKEHAIPLNIWGVE